ncbi:MAG: hypothetical protein LBP22_14125 [Deltaproteobacteria bacterium]|jgi:hypothetical protein|nr:hypothetical protein [Deltaproteobacteria bacterium]
MTMNKVKLHNDRIDCAYTGVDTAKKFEGIRNLGLREDPEKPMSDEEFEMKTKAAGMFAMISSMKTDKPEHCRIIIRERQSKYSTQAKITPDCSR